MADHHPHTEHEGYETTDAKIKPLILFTVGLLVLVILSFLSMTLMFKLMAHHETSTDAPTGYVRDERWRTPDIQLETNRARLREELNKLEHEQLTTYALLDPAAGKVRIPINRAIEIIAAKGLPYKDLKSSADEEGSPALTESGGQESVVY